MVGALPTHAPKVLNIRQIQCDRIRNYRIVISETIFRYNDECVGSPAFDYFTMDIFYPRFSVVTIYSTLPWRTKEFARFRN